MITVGGITFRTQEELRTQKLEGKNRTNVILDDKTIGLLKELASIYNTSASEIMRTLLCNFAIEQKKEIAAMETDVNNRLKITSNK